MQATIEYNQLLKRALDLHGPRGLNELLPAEMRKSLKYAWNFWGRPAIPIQNRPRYYRGQIPPDANWDVCLFLGGRGTGKTKSLAEWCRSKAENYPKCRINFVGRDMGDARKVGIFGDSGVMACCPPWDKPDWSPVDACLRWKNGSMLSLFSAEAPLSLRGTQCHFLAADELAAWNRGRPDEAWNLAILGMRLDRNPIVRPQAFIATTPLPIRLLRDLRNMENTIVLQGGTLDNPFLAQSYKDYMTRLFAGTSFGRQELEGELLDCAEGALFSLEIMDKFRVARAPQLKKIIVSADPSAGSNRDNDESGVVVLGLGVDDAVYLLDDKSKTMSPDQWGITIVNSVKTWNANYVIAENQRGGTMVETIIKKSPGGANLTVKPVPAQLPKEVRAFPVAAASERGQFRIVGRQDALERELVSWVPSARRQWSPGRLDAVVHGVLDLLMLGAPVHYESNRGIGHRRI